MRYTRFFTSCPPPLLRGIRGDSSCLLPLAYSVFPVPCSLKTKNLYLTQFKIPILYNT
ncbi:MAG: hypothetical protein F6J90_22350 [Moorea sp. SIOASIH]|uniref:hypothetical protein n=1 Tax=Moorena sp. SIOASIH TaxID=2607817 RepID=UPI0013BD7731|nr:hypothetical protein [Moorena sp. SIOASIH]NEO38930.1 hypothetical protein [Moorena sp. SIOASIH]